MLEVLGKLWLWATCVGRAVLIPIAFSAEQGWGQGCENLKCQTQERVLSHWHQD